MMDSFLGLNKSKGSKGKGPYKKSKENNEEFSDDPLEVSTVQETGPSSSGGKRKRVKVSSVWKYFKRSSDNKLAKCLECGREYKTSGKTSNLADHLKRHHPLKSTQNVCECETSEDESVNNATGFSSTSTSARSSGRSGTGSSGSISPFFKRALQYDSNSQKKKQIDNAVIQMVALDFQPFSIVRDKGFQKLINLLDPRYVLPSPYTLSKTLLNNCYEETRAKLKDNFKSVKYVAITTDSWTSCVQESYVTVTCHYLQNFELKSNVLSTKPLENGMNHTSENLAEALREIFDEWELKEKISCIVTDNAANMLKMCEILKIRHLPCFAHTLNLVVQENFDCVRPLLKKCKEIVTFIKTSNVAMELFKKEQQIISEETYNEYKLIQDVSTRWNSTYYMIKRIVKTNEAINRTLIKIRKAPQPLTVDELSILNDCIKLLKCFEEATKKVSGSNFVTISLIIPITFGILNFLRATNLDTEEGKIFCNGLLESVKRRLFPYETRGATKVATLIDPRFKKEGFRSAENATSAAALLEQEMYTVSRKVAEEEKHVNLDEGGEGSSNSSNTQSINSKSSSLFAFLENRISTKIRSVTADVIITKRQYLERPNADEGTDPLLFWKINGIELSPINECVEKFLIIPATSVESERTFSSAGQVVTERRSKLRASNVNKLTFLHKNLNLF